MAGLRSPWWRVVDWVAVVVVGGVFLYAAGMKIHAPATFGDDIYGFGILPGWSVAPAAILLPWIEAIAALALFWPRLRRSGALLIAGMLVIFIVAAGSVMARGLEVPCGCLGPTGRMVGWGLIVFDAALLTGAMWLLSRGAARSVPGVAVQP